MRPPATTRSRSATHTAASLYALNDYFTRTDVLAFLILKDGKPVFERYLVGTGPTDRYLSMSVSKSIVSVLVGVAVDEKKIASIDDPVVKYLPRLKDSGYKNVTIRNLLNMASGIEFSEDYGVAGSGIGQLTAANRSGQPSFLEFIASLKSERAPGTFNYQSVNTQVLAELLKATTGAALNTYAETKLWKKIGAESRAYYLTGKSQEGICAYGCFYATLRDYARVGLMAMRGGKLTDQRVVSEAWLKQSGRAVRETVDQSGNGTLPTRLRIPVVGAVHRRRRVSGVGHQRPGDLHQSEQAHRHRAVQRAGAGDGSGSDAGER